MNTQESVLLRTSAATDAKCGGALLSITGLPGIRKSSIASITQIKYKAEVAQVVTVGGTSYTPVASTDYTVLIGDTQRQRGGVQEQLKKYSYTTPATLTDIGATAALQREAIHVALVALINNDTSNKVAAATLGTGTGFTVTDDGGYYSAFSHTGSNTLGASTVITAPDASSGLGFADNYSVTTAAVYASGVGATLAAGIPVVDPMAGGLLSGYLSNKGGFSFKTVTGLAAETGQKYDIFVVNYLNEVPAFGGNGGQRAFIPKAVAVAVDNGAGASTTNATGFAAFERAMVTHALDVFRSDPNTIISMFDNMCIGQGLGTGLPSGVAQAENVLSFGNGFSAHYSPIATSTLLVPLTSADGLNLILDATASEGIEVSGPTWTNSQKEFVVGKQPFSIYAKVKIDDVSGLNPFWVGFRKKEAYQATFTAYADYAVVGLGSGSGDIYTNTEKNGAGNTATDTTDNWADNETHTLEVRVDINGACTFFVDGAKPTVTQTFSFDSGDSIIPVIYALQTADIGTPMVSALGVVASDNWRR